MAKDLIKLWSRPYTVQYTEETCYLDGIDGYFPEEKNETGFAEQKKWNAFHKKIIKKYNSPLKVRGLIELLHLKGKKYVSLTNKISSSDLSKATNFQLIKDYKKYSQQLNSYTTTLFHIYLVNDAYSQKAEKILIAKKASPEIYQSLLSPIKKCGVILLENKLTKAKSKKEILKISQDFLWMPCLDINTNPWTEKDVFKFYKGIKKETKKITYSQAIKKIKLNSKEKKLFDLVRELAYAKDIRDVYRRQGIYNILPFFKEIAKRLKITRNDLVYLTSSEIINGLKGDKVNKKLIQDRKKGFLIYVDQNKTVITTNKKEIKKFQARAIKEETQGIIASQGTARGKAKIITQHKDLGKIKKGDIMIAITTHPEFVPAMQKAAAIITDEGGMTCHAAIISRELGIPCIVGTKNSTKIYKDNNLLIIDTKKGVIKKYES